jgi:hypothetical protein
MAIGALAALTEPRASINCEIKECERRPCYREAIRSTGQIQRHQGEATLQAREALQEAELERVILYGVLRNG